LILKNIGRLTGYSFDANRDSAKELDPLDPQDFGFLDPDPQKHADSRIWIQGVKYQPKTAKNNLFIHLNPNSELLKKERL